MMHREVDYHLEAKTTSHFCQLLRDDTRFVVPKVYPRYSTDNVMATSFEAGENVASTLVSKLPQARRNKLAKSSFRVVSQGVV